MQSPFEPAILFHMLDSAGLRSADVARALGVSRAAVCNWRKGNYALSPEHYAGLVKLAASYETTWLAIHRAMSQQAPDAEPMPGYRLHVQAFAGDYRAQMHQSFRACVESVRALITDQAGWNYETLCAVTEELAGMSRALRIIMKGEATTCPDIIPQANGSK